jgi:hypothetical protein
VQLCLVVDAAEGNNDKACFGAIQELPVLLRWTPDGGTLIVGYSTGDFRIWRQPRHLDSEPLPWAQVHFHMLHGTRMRLLSEVHWDMMRCGGMYMKQQHVELPRLSARNWNASRVSFRLGCVYASGEGASRQLHRVPANP